MHGKEFDLLTYWSNGGEEAFKTIDHICMTSKTVYTLVALMFLGWFPNLPDV